MKLDRLIGGSVIDDVRGDPSATEVLAITYDSRRVAPGALFCCLRGAAFDGHDFAGDAVATGAAAVLCERVLPLDVTQVVVREVRPAMAVAAGAFFGHPSRRLTVVGVTGTNGKTTTSHLLGAVFEAAGRPAVVLGTLSGSRTTPEAPDLQSGLAHLAAGPTAAVAMEVSSHALVQHRVDDTWFTAAVFTNLSVDHLDYHGSLDAYFEAKKTLFDPARCGLAVVNADDPYGRVLMESPRVPTLSFSLDDAVDLEPGATSSSFRWDGAPVRLGLGGLFNVPNALAAATVARALGVQASEVAEGLSSVSSIPGRFETIDAGQPFLVVVDYAHTPAGLEHVLTAGRHAAAAAPRRARVLVAFGCGGERDRTKRPLMGEVASRLADLVVLTSDNPRSEDPAVIIEEVRAGATGPGELVVEPDRRAAIARLLGDAKPGDVVVVAGKGHETTQTVAGRALPFDDRRVVSEELERLGLSGNREGVLGW